MSIRDQVRQLEAYRFKATPAGVKLDQNEFPSDLPPALRKRAIERIRGADFHRYPEIHADSLRRAIADFDGWEPSGVVVSSGSNVLIQALVIAAGLGQRVVTVRPTFSVYGIQGRILADTLTEVPLEEGFGLPEDALIDTLATGSGILFLANPAAPTGNRHPDEQIERIVQHADPARWLVVLDEAYWQFARRNHADLARRHAHVVLLRTLSKAFGLGGVRLGYALCHPDVAAQVQKVILPFSVSALQTAVGVEVLEHPTLVAERVDMIVGERERVAKALLQRPGVHVFPSVTNFILFRVADAEAVFGGLAERGVVVRKQHGAPGLDGCLRVSIGHPNENDRFLEALAAVVNEEEIHA